ncbi:MAG: alpha-L-fucosidase [Spirochaetaceae bacterium]|nr:MAG: alpha-L-fucosidase [Spirochaetaceae bacterium]
MEFTADSSSLSGHVIPDWFSDAKFGIFIHWGPYSVPAYAPVGETDIAGLFASGDMEALFRLQPYAEWYQNSIRIPGSPAAAYHVKTYGKDADYADFATAFNEAADSWKPEEWGELFRDAGARYVVLVTKHHDGFTLWPSKHRNPRMPTYHATRNIVAELTDTVRAHGMRMGYYYSGLLDWTYTKKPIRDFVDLMTNTPTSREYVSYQENHWRELINEYKPSILWSDIGYPPGSNPAQLMADYYNTVLDGVVNDRWVQLAKPKRLLLRMPGLRNSINKRAAEALSGTGTNPLKPVHHDFTTPEYTTLNWILETKWECTRGIGRSFAYNQYEPDEMYLTLPELLESFIDIISKNGNLLLNVGPRADGTIPEIQSRLLREFGAELSRLKTGVYGSRPHTSFGYDGESGEKIRYTRKGDTVYCFVFPNGQTEVTIQLTQDVDARSIEVVTDDCSVVSSSGSLCTIGGFSSTGSNVFLLKCSLK